MTPALLLKDGDRIRVAKKQTVARLAGREGKVCLVYPDGAVSVTLDGEARLTFFERNEVVKVERLAS